MQRLRSAGSRHTGHGDMQGLPRTPVAGATEGPPTGSRRGSNATHARGSPPARRRRTRRRNVPNRGTPLDATPARPSSSTETPGGARRPRRPSESPRAASPPDQDTPPQRMHAMLASPKRAVPDQMLLSPALQGMHHRHASKHDARGGQRRRRQLASERDQGSRTLPQRQVQTEVDVGKMETNHRGERAGRSPPGHPRTPQWAGGSTGDSRRRARPTGAPHIPLRSDMGANGNGTRQATPPQDGQRDVPGHIQEMEI